MANNSVNVTQGTGTQMSADLVGEVFHPTVKVEFGSTGSATQVDETNPLPVTSNFNGLRLGGKVTEVTLNPTTWVALPASVLTGRNALNVQNWSGQEIKVNYSNTIVGYVGMVIPHQGERQYAITGQIIMYGKSSTSTCVINVEELA